VFRDDFEVEMRYSKGSLEVAASTQLNVPPSKGPVVALSSGARAGIEYKVFNSLNTTRHPPPYTLHPTFYTIHPIASSLDAKH